MTALANFRARYNLSANTMILGPYSGRLDNAGESVALFEPDSPQTAPHPDAGFVPYVLVDQVGYSNRAPWPEGADGTGMSLQRRLASQYGNEPLNWLACSPSPAGANCGVDADNDSLPDDGEIANGLDPHSGLGTDDPGGDPDADRFTNLQEYLAGTAPRDPQRSRNFFSVNSLGIKLRGGYGIPC